MDELDLPNLCKEIPFAKYASVFRTRYKTVLLGRVLRL